ncbi:MAG: hypothetical protein JXM70_29420 [Pirellulales bacterium]|nr:hypothetical protein [Pirellulales bacterium]
MSRIYRNPMDVSTVACGIMLTLTCILAGCGGPEGPARYEITGKATFGGKAIPAGKIMFVPDRSKNNTGSRGIARIENGQYKTLPGQGATGGPQVVSIQGYDGVNPPGWSGSDMGSPIFQRYEKNIELPAENTTVDFDVPVKR